MCVNFSRASFKTQDTAAKIRGHYYRHGEKKKVCSFNGGGEFRNQLFTSYYWLFTPFHKNKSESKMFVFPTKEEETLDA